MTASDHPLPLLRGNHPAALSNYVVTRCSRLLWNVAGANEGMEFFILIFINFILHLKDSIWFSYWKTLHMEQFDCVSLLFTFKVYKI